ncbi:MAG: hypothetical protein ACYDHP_13465 [Ferrimicrobium sp.]
MSSKTIGDRCDEITEWRAGGVTWAEIADRLGRANPRSVRELYRREVARRPPPITPTQVPQPTRPQPQIGTPSLRDQATQRTLATIEARLARLEARAER